MKWEAILAMVALFALGLWLVWGPARPAGLPEIREGAQTVQMRIGNVRGEVEVLDVGDGRHEFRLLFREGTATFPFDDEQFISRFGKAVYDETLTNMNNPIFRLLNITSWWNVGWVAIGFAGQIAFFGRMFIQWMVSEREKRSVVPEIFWWLSLGGGIALFTYFAWRQDIVGVMGQTSGVVIYARNLRLIHKRRKRAERQRARRQPKGDSPTNTLADPAPEPVDEKDRHST